MVFLGMIMFVITLALLPTVASDQATAVADANISGSMVAPFVEFSTLLFFLPAIGVGIGGFVAIMVGATKGS